MCYGQTAVIGSRGAFNDGRTEYCRKVTADVQGATKSRFRELAFEEKKLATETRRMELEADAQIRAAELELRKMELEMRKAKMEMKNAEADRDTRRLEQHRGQEGGVAAGAMCVIHYHVPGMNP